MPQSMSRASASAFQDFDIDPFDVGRNFEANGGIAVCIPRSAHEMECDRVTLRSGELQPPLTRSIKRIAPIGDRSDKATTGNLFDRPERVFVARRLKPQEIAKVYSTGR